MDEHRGRITKDGIRIYEAGDFAGMHKAGELAARILDDMAAHVFPGQTTGEIDRVITDNQERSCRRDKPKDGYNLQGISPPILGVEQNRK